MQDPCGHIKSLQIICEVGLGERLDTIDDILESGLHYLQPEEQKRVLEKCIANLNAGGTVIIRDGDKDVADKHKRTKLTEFFSTRLLKFNKTTGSGLSFFSGQLIRTIAADNNMSCSEQPDSKVTSNTIFILKKRA